MVRQAHHERIAIALKFSDLAVRPEPVEGRPVDYDTVSQQGEGNKEGFSLIAEAAR
jgi:hypothetical protein